MRWDAEKYDLSRAPQADAGRILLSMLDPAEEDAVLDIGCGTGRLTIDLSRMVPRGSVLGIDPSEEMIEKSRENAAGIPNISFFTTSVESMEFQDRFDLAFSNLALHWVKDQGKALDRVFAALKRGGGIGFQLPAEAFCPPFFRHINDAISLLGLEGCFTNWESPWYYPSEDEYRTLLLDAGFAWINVFCRDFATVFESTDAVCKWLEGAGLRPYLAVLPVEEHERFKAAVAAGFEEERKEEGIILRFHRLFAFAEKS